ncbi:putative diguanylate cyclase/phosphodiesterase (GGDEF and EAL domains) [Salinisphaera dokdonensis CL-ES53]|uniref:Diguanylate cyclase/phosphodiesterase (GGDEF and EAL domains) n=1 Tax=Salinisphaera dokdonensis CL-ES53 TaxID=1304272 RepID=A0ABV2B4H6_9GAMM
MMKSLRIPTNEDERLEALRRSDLLNLPRDAIFDRISQLAARLLDMPIASVTLIDESKQWFKSAVGVDIEQVPRDASFCTHAIHADVDTVAHDTTQDARFATNPFVAGEPHVRFYAGAPLRSAEGYSLGTLCVLDTKPRHDFQDAELKTLHELADILSSWIKLRDSAGYLDASTGVFTRRRMIEQIARELKQADKQPSAAVRLVGIADVALPKQMHDLSQVMGHEQTEKFVIECIDRLSSAIGIEHDLYRIGLYRFGFFLSGSIGAGVQRKLNALVKKLHEPFDSGVGVLLAPSATLGVTAITARSSETAEEVLRQASVAADDAWGSSRYWAFYEPQSDALRARKLRLLTDLPDALAGSEQLYLVYQPKIDLATGACVGVEALLRWEHPTLGPVSPIELIDAAEKTALMRPLTNWVIDAALSQRIAWQEQGLTLQIAVNLSAYDLADDNIVNRVCQGLEKHGLPGESLELEFTESTLIRDLDAVIPKLEQLHAFGVSTAIDDFGTGYCNLSYLLKLNVSKIKIDRRFVQALEEHSRGKTLIRAIIRLAQDLDYRIVVEGVENESTVGQLIEWGCEQAQGYLFSKPLRADALSAWVAARGVAN